MRILFISNDGFDASLSRVPLSNWFYRNKKWVIDILSPRGHCMDLDAGICYELQNRGINWSNLCKINNTIKHNGYDLIIARGIESIILLSLSKTGRSKCFFLLTGLGRLFDKRLFCKVVIRFIYRNLLKLMIGFKKSHVILQNEDDAHDLRLENYHLMNGSGFPSVITNNHYSGHKTNTILTATRLSLSKGLKSIIDLAEYIVDNRLSLNYVILGDYNHLPDSYIRKIKKLNQSTNIRFVGFDSDTDKYFVNSQFSFFPTMYREGAPRFLIQSLSHGLIIFTNPEPGCSHTISNKNGYLYSSVETMVNQIFELQKSPKELSNLRNRSIELFEKVYKDERVYEKLFQFLSYGK